VSPVCSRGKFHGYWGAARAEVERAMHPHLARVVAREGAAQRKGWVVRIQAAERRYGSGVVRGVGVAPRCGACGGALVPAWTWLHELRWRLRRLARA
jgi:hypothetical protein